MELSLRNIVTGQSLPKLDSPQSTADLIAEAWMSNHACQNAACECTYAVLLKLLYRPTSSEELDVYQEMHNVHLICDYKPAHVHLFSLGKGQPAQSLS